MHRVLIPPRAVDSDSITINDPRDVHHLTRVLRAKSGEAIECFDGQGRTYRGRIAHASGEQLIVEVHQRLDEPPPRVKLSLIQSLIPPAQFEWVLQKATELGAARITPVITQRTTTRRSSGTGRHRMERWQRIVIEATAQCGRATLPVVDEPAQFEDVVKTFGARDVLLPTLVDPRVPLADHLNRLHGSADIVILVGPEGDFTSEEVLLAQRAGAHPVSLGRATLRSETAAITTLAILQHALGLL